MVREAGDAARDTSAFPGQVKKGFSRGFRHTLRIKMPSLSFQLVDLAGEPIPNVDFELTSPSGATRVGTLDEDGCARFDKLEEGECRITFPTL